MLSIKLTKACTNFSSLFQIIFGIIFYLIEGLHPAVLEQANRCLFMHERTVLTALSYKVHHTLAL